MFFFCVQCCIGLRERFFGSLLTHVWALLIGSLSNIVFKGTPSVIRLFVCSIRLACDFPCPVPVMANVVPYERFDVGMAESSSLGTGVPAATRSSTAATLRTRPCEALGSALFARHQV
jgi:hypothetical protein